MTAESLRGGAYGLAAAALFGASAPVAKLLLPASSPLVLSALLYLGAGAGLSLFQLVRKRPGEHREAPLRKADVLPLAGIILFGGVAGPVLMLAGLARVSGVAGSLLLNLEAPLTVLLAVLVFREHLGLREAGAAACVFAGAAVVSAGSGELAADRLGAAALAGACLSWSIDNNLSQRLSLRDPVVVAQVKTLGAGACTALLALAAGSPMPSPRLAASGLIVGSLSYGLSLVLALRSMRLLGAAREATYFATAPFLGALLSVPLLAERPHGAELFAALLMAGGIALLLREHHSHEHTHAELEHEHLHVHDEHHQHAHDGPVSEPHSHRHRHVRMTHAHPHASDLHHRHSHGEPHR